MSKHPASIRALLVSLAILCATPAIAADGQITITQAKANAGNVTPGDTPGFPVTLSQSGSYILASNLQPPDGRRGIVIARDHVTIDLNGFQLNGAAGATTGIYGDASESVTIRNGTITGFHFLGIYGPGGNWIVEDMRVVENGTQGIYVGGNYSTVRRSTAAENAGDGIYCAFHCLVEDSTSSGNGGTGISFGSGSVLGNVIIGNTGFGIASVNSTGYGNNTLAFNNSGGSQVVGTVALHPNACDPACP